MKVKIQWVDEPPEPVNGQRGKWGEALAPLREEPGRWALIGRIPPAVAYNVNKGVYVGIEKGEFRAVTRNVDHDLDEADVYVQYVG